MALTTRTRLVFFVVPLALLAMSSPAPAQTFIGNVCWALDPFTDTIRVAVTEHPDGIFGLNVRWRGVFMPGNTFGTVLAGLSGTPDYQLQGTGTASVDLGDPGSVVLSVAALGNSASLPPAKENCTLNGAISTGTLNGTWSVLCPAAGFFRTGTLTFLNSCPAGS